MTTYFPRSEVIRNEVNIYPSPLVTLTKGQYDPDLPDDADAMLIAETLLITTDRLIHQVTSNTSNGIPTFLLEEGLTSENYRKKIQRAEEAGGVKLGAPSVHAGAVERGLERIIDQEKSKSFDKHDIAENVKTRSKRIKPKEIHKHLHRGNQDCSFSAGIFIAGNCFDEVGK